MKLFGLTNLSSAAFSLVIGVLLTGCFSEAKNLSTYQDLTQNSSKSDQVVTIFVKGEIDLSCGPTCSGDWGFNQRKIKYYWKSGQMTELAKTVIAINHGVDLSYFYLGQAAEGLGYLEAAKMYYNKAKHFPYKCDGFFDNCDGINVPKETEAALKRIEN